MSPIPDLALSFVTAHQTPLLHWFSGRIYADLLKRMPDHLLVKLRQRCPRIPHPLTPTPPIAYTATTKRISATMSASLSPTTLSARFRPTPVPNLTPSPSQT